MNILMVLVYIAAAFLATAVLLRLSLASEIKAAMERDPAARSPWEVLFMYPSVSAVGCHRLAHLLHRMGLRFLARLISQTSRGLTGIEIHPGAQIGKEFFIDHGMGVVIGETAIIGNSVTLFQGVTLGGTGKERGKRHPTLGNNVVVGAGAKVLGSISIGDNVQIGANAVVVREVPANCSVVGVPGRIVRQEGRRFPGINLDHTSLPDPLTQSLERLQNEIDHIEHELKEHRRKTSS